ncbi:MAG: NfeD family protein [Sedimentisphaerales bacterium]|nr:NfeD family protein [Sedimentisphaerales bacterium]
MDWIKDLLKPELIWFLVGLGLLIMEFILPGLVIGFFGAGAWVVAIACFISGYVKADISIQLLIFIVSSVLSLVLLRKWAKGIFMGHSEGEQNLNDDLKEFVGERVVVKEKITPKAVGKVEMHGTNWRAAADYEIEVGTVVEVVRKENITLIVKPI